MRFNDQIIELLADIDPAFQLRGSGTVMVALDRFDALRLIELLKAINVAKKTGEIVPICESHLSMWLNDEDGCEAAFSSQVKPWRKPCRMVDRLITEPL